MSDRDRIAAIVGDYTNDDAYEIADALIAAGVDFVCPACGSAQCSGADGQWCPLDKAAHESELAAGVTVPTREMRDSDTCGMGDPAGDCEHGTRKSRYCPQCDRCNCDQCRAGVTMPAPPEGETDRALCWCGESAESTGWGVCEKHFDVDRCNKPQGDPGRFCILSSGHDGRCF